MQLGPVLGPEMQSVTEHRTAIKHKSRERKRPARARKDQTGQEGQAGQAAPASVFVCLGCLGGQLQARREGTTKGVERVGDERGNWSQAESKLGKGPPRTQETAILKEEKDSSSTFNCIELLR